MFIISGLTLTYNFFQFTRDLNQSLVNNLTETGWFYSPSDIYFVTKDNYLFAREVKTEKIKWEFELTKKKGLDNSVLSPFFDHEIAYFALGNSIYALDINTGKQKWIFTGEDYINYSPDIDNNVIYIANRAGYFHALNSITGKEVWHFNINEISPKITALKAPFPDKKNEDLLKHLPKSENLKPGLKLTMNFEKVPKQETYNYFYKFYKLTDTGKQIQSFKARKTDENQIIRQYDKTLNLHNKEILSQDNNINFKAGNLSKSLMAFNNNLYFSYKEKSGNYFYSLGNNPPKLNWKLKYEPKEFITNKSFSYFEDDNYLCAIDNKTGKEIWKFHEHGALSKLIFKEGIIYIQDSLYSFYALDGRTGEEKWYFKSKDLIFSPLVFNNSVYLTLSGFSLDTESYLYVLETISGKLKWKLKLNKDEWIYSLNVNNGNVFLITSIKEKAQENNFLSGFWNKILM